jgi:ribosomal protein L37E
MTHTSSSLLPTYCGRAAWQWRKQICQYGWFVARRFAAVRWDSVVANRHLAYVILIWYLAIAAASKNGYQRVTFA